MNTTLVVHITSSRRAPSMRHVTTSSARARVRCVGVTMRGSVLSSCSLCICLTSSSTRWNGGARLFGGRRAGYFVNCSV